MPQPDRRRSVLNERPLPNEQLFDPLSRCSASLSNSSEQSKGATSYRPSAPPTALAATVPSSTAASEHLQRQNDSQKPKQPTPVHPHSPSQSPSMTQHSMSIPERISARGGSISDFMAEVAALFWFESTKLLEKLETTKKLAPGIQVQPLTQAAIASQHFKKWVSSVLTTTQVTQNVVILALLYIHRLKKANPTVKGRPGSEYRLLTVALMLGNKFLDDNTYTNKTWADVSGISVNDIHVMEVEFLSNMRYSLLVSAEEWDQWIEKLARFWSYLELVQQSQTASAPSPLMIPSPTHRAYASPLHSPTVPVTPAAQSTTHSSTLQSPTLGPAANASQTWARSRDGSSANSPLAMKAQLQPSLHRKRSFPDENPAEYPSKRANLLPAGQGNVASQAPLQYSSNGLQAQVGLVGTGTMAPVQSRPAPAPLPDHGRQHVPNLTLNTAQATADVSVTQPQTYTAPAYTLQQPSLTLPPLASSGRALSMVFPNTTYQPSQPVPASGGAATPTTSFPPMSYNTPAKRLSPQNTLATYPGSSPLVIGNGATSGLHTPISHSPSIYLQQRSSPYKPVRHVNTLLYPPPSAFLQQYQLPNPVLPNQMHYQPLGKRNEYRTGIVPEFLDSAHRVAGYHQAPVPQMLPNLPAHSQQSRAQYQLPSSARAGPSYPGQY